MKFELWQIDKTKDKNLALAIDKLLARLQPLHPLSLKTIKGGANKGLSPQQIKERQGQTILDLLQPADYLILLDEKGTLSDSRSFARKIERWRDMPTKRGVFLIGGAYGFSPTLYKRAQQKLSLSPMTFTHQLIRLIFMEQIYRAFTIIHNLPYHNE